MTSGDLFGEEPRDLNLVDYVRDRADEVCDLLAVVHNYDLPTGEVSHGPRTFVQRLPRHLRRRAMSHNVKRLPRKMQQQQGVEQISNTKHKKPPSRYHRRRPANLLNEYVRRQRKCMWLETHIWHAKRFHMRDMWSYKIAERSAARGYRASYRDAAKHCLVIDVSYISCLQLDAQEHVLTQGLGRMTSVELGPTFRQYCALQGRCQGNVVLYKPDAYPASCIGPVSFMWKPRGNEDSLRRSLWIWCHPSIHQEVVQNLVAVFDLSQESDVGLGTCDGEDTGTVEMHKHKLTHTPVFSNDEKSVALMDLKDEFFRFRLTGPMSTTVIGKCLQPNVGNGLLDRLGSQPPSSVADGMIVAMHVTDPRLLKIGYSKVKPVVAYDYSSSVEYPDVELSPDWAKSQIWDCKFRRQCLLNKMSDKDLNEMRSKLLGADSSLILDAKPPNLVPILLVCTSNTFASGWDVIGPVGWSMPFWLALQMNSARAAGQKEARAMALYSNALHFPSAWPDTYAGVQYEAAESNQIRDKYMKRPHNKRVQYEALKIVKPFCFPWAQLVGASSDCTGLQVCRHRKTLKQLNVAISNGQSLKEYILPPSTLIPIKIQVALRDVPKRRAIVCIPNENDVELMKRGGQVVEDCVIQTEKGVENKKRHVSSNDTDDMMCVSTGEKDIALDSLFADMRETRAHNRKLAKKVKKKARKMAKVDMHPEPTADVCQSQQFVHTCARRIVGLVVQGDFVFSEGSAYGLGYCSFEGLQLLVEKRKDAYVLFRNTTSKYYHLAKLSVLTSPFSM